MRAQRWHLTISHAPLRDRDPMGCHIDGPFENAVLSGLVELEDDTPAGALIRRGSWQGEVVAFVYPSPDGQPVVLDGKSPDLCPPSSPRIPPWDTEHDGIVDRIAAVWPIEALRHGMHSLSNARIGWCTAYDPERIDRSTIARLPDFAIDVLAWADPEFALRVVANRLSYERLDWCAEKYPLVALEYALDRLSVERIDAIAAVHSWQTLKVASSRMSQDCIMRCFESCPGEVMLYAPWRLPPELLAAGADECPIIALTGPAVWLLSDNQFKRLARQHPHAALKYARERMPAALRRELEGHTRSHESKKY